MPPGPNLLHHLDNGLADEQTELIYHHAWQTISSISVLRYSLLSINERNQKIDLFNNVQNHLFHKLNPVVYSIVCFRMQKITHLIMNGIYKNLVVRMK